MLLPLLHRCGGISPYASFISPLLAELGRGTQAGIMMVVVVEGGCRTGAAWCGGTPMPVAVEVTPKFSLCKWRFLFLCPLFNWCVCVRKPGGGSVWQIKHVAHTSFTHTHTHTHTHTARTLPLVFLIFKFLFGGWFVSSFLPLSPLNNNPEFDFDTWIYSNLVNYFWD